MPRSPRNRALLRRSAVGVFVMLAVCGLAWAATPDDSSGGPAWYSIVPPLLAATLALATGRLRLCLVAAVLAGGLLSVVGGDFGPGETVVQGLGQAGTFFLHSVWPGMGDTSHLQILLYVVLIMAMISVVLAAGGLQGVAGWLTRFARSPRSAKLVTMATGLVIFIDDYANTMIVGPTMRPITDRHRISREKLAFLVDATAAPVAGVAVISTWIGYEVGLLSETAQSLGIARDGYAIFFDALGYRFYCMGMIAFVFFNSLLGQDFGPMAKAEERARKDGKLFEDHAEPITSQAFAASEPHRQANVHPMVAVVPMVTLLVVFVGGLWIDGGGWTKMSADMAALFRFSVWRDVLSQSDSIFLLVCASASGLATAAVMALAVARIPASVTYRAMLAGAKTSLLPLSVLVLAWSLQASCDRLQTGTFLANLLAEKISPGVFPALVFLVAGLTAFATGTSWGTMAILIPTAIPVAFQLDGGAYGPVAVICVAAVLDGAIFGDHCSPISDTTIMSSAASACDHLAHVRTQMPYSLVVAAMVLCVGYLPAAGGMSKWVGILAVVVLPGLLLLGLKTRTRRR